MNTENKKEQPKTEEQKLTPGERKKKLEVETHNPIPSVPNRAWTEMNTSSSVHGNNTEHTHAQSAFYVNTDRYKSTLHGDSTRRREKE